MWRYLRLTKIYFFIKKTFHMNFALSTEKNDNKYVLNTIESY